MGFCPYCGSPVEQDWTHCAACGKKKPNKTAKDVVESTPQAIAVSEELPPTGEFVTYVPARQKSTAVVLAVLFGYWAWLYTYRKDSTKFWSVLLFSIVFGFVVNYFTYAAAYKSSSSDSNFGILVLVALLSFMVAWVWPIVNVSTRDYAEIDAVYPQIAVRSPAPPLAGASANNSNISGAPTSCRNCGGINAPELKKCKFCGTNF